MPPTPPIPTRQSGSHACRTTQSALGPGRLQQRDHAAERVGVSLSRSRTISMSGVCPACGEVISSIGAAPDLCGIGRVARDVLAIDGPVSADDLAQGDVGCHDGRGHAAAAPPPILVTGGCILIQCWSMLTTAQLVAGRRLANPRLATAREGSPEGSPFWQGQRRFSVDLKKPEIERHIMMRYRTK